MPEGDTVHKIANWLAPRLTSRRLERVTMVDMAAASRCRGHRVEAVYAIGKHLFIELDNAHALRSHLGMHGAWHFYGPGQPWKKPQCQASLVVGAGDTNYVCFNAKEIELVAANSVRRRIIEDRLGPDLIAADPDPQRLVVRARQLLEPDDLLADALLDQRVAAGIGNVYKSEILFLAGRHPESALAATPDDDVARCFAVAADLLRRNLGGGKRVTRFEDDGAGRLWVYGRSGLPCHRCETGIVGKRLGRHHRGTFWCPQCQAVAPTVALDGS